MSRVSYTYMLCVWWLVLVVVPTSASVDTDCPIRSDALDVASRAYVSPQVVEAVVKDMSPTVPGQPYTVTVSVSRILRRYRGPSRLRRRATLSLTLRLPLADTDSENSVKNSDSVGDCLVSASLKRRRYLFFLSGPKERGSQAVPVAPPELANKKLRRVVRKMVCNKCGEYSSSSSSFFMFPVLPCSFLVPTEGKSVALGDATRITPRFTYFGIACH